ncbi:DUF4169 family protein [Alterinioella nitratireducens]|uniref:DUF4169 family protein n=1 Tax=Alterinioella nitratireducens TaxID=2735915 RepID=UPI001556EBF8|nr:DUF4169 family protein [Alterinioella nitratireducens]NPD19148.1 DUF4169 family protein [Alterinioella nitratireducens]
MAAPVNLNRARKEKARAEKKARADENAVRFGRAKAERMLEEARARKAARELDGAKREEP